MAKRRVAARDTLGDLNLQEGGEGSPLLDSLQGSGYLNSDDYMLDDPEMAQSFTDIGNLPLYEEEVLGGQPLQPELDQEFLQEAPLDQDLEGIFTPEERAEADLGREVSDEFAEVNQRPLDQDIRDEFPLEDLQALSQLGSDEALPEQDRSLYEGQEAAQEIPPVEAQAEVQEADRQAQEQITEDIPEGEIKIVPPEEGTIEEAFQNPDVLRAIELSSGLQLSPEDIKEIEENEAALLDPLNERAQFLNEKMKSNQMTDKDYMLLGAAFLIPTMLAYSKFGAEGMAKSLSSAIGEVEKAGMEQIKQTEADRKEFLEIEQRKGKVKEGSFKTKAEMLKNIPDADLKKELQGKKYIVTPNGQVGFKLGVPYVYYDVNNIEDKEDLKAARKGSEEVRKQVKFVTDTDEILDELSQTVSQIRQSGDTRSLDGLAASVFSGTAPTAKVDGKETNLYMRLRSQLGRFNDLYKNAIKQKQLTEGFLHHVDTIITDPTTMTGLLSTDLETMESQMDTIKNRLRKELLSEADSFGFLREPLEKRFPVSDAEFDKPQTEEQIQEELKNMTGKQLKSFVRG